MNWSILRAIRRPRTHVRASLSASPSPETRPERPGPQHHVSIRGAFVRGGGEKCMKAYRAIFAFRALHLYTFRALGVVGWVGIPLTRPDETPAFAARPGKSSHLESFSGTGHLLALEIRGSPCAVPENGPGTCECERRRDDNEEHNSCERSCVRHGRRNGYRRWTYRVQRADVLLLRLQVQREVRS